MNNTTFTPTADVLALGTYYIATNYNIKPDNAADMNTENLQKLVDQVSANGGGTIYFPVGTYYFGIGDTLLRKDTTIPYSIKMESNVSIIGQNMEKTVLKQICETSTDDNGNEIPNPYSLFVYLNPVNESTKGENGTPVFPENFIPITGCTYSNFTVDASETTKPTGKNIYYAKAFYYQYVKDCVFRDLILKETLGSALGIDYLDNVQIENVIAISVAETFLMTIRQQVLQELVSVPVDGQMKTSTFTTVPVWVPDSMEFLLKTRLALDGAAKNCILKAALSPTALPEMENIEDWVSAADSMSPLSAVNLMKMPLMEFMWMVTVKM